MTSKSNILLLAVFLGCAAAAQEGSPVTLDERGKLVYHPTPQGDRVVDFSYAGYGGGGVPLPSFPVVQRVKSSGADDTAAIQQAIDAVAALPLHDGVRGAVLLAPGTFQCSRPLQITASGVVLRGSGESATILQLAGAPHLAINIGGKRAEENIGPVSHIADSYVPSGAAEITVTDASQFHAGDRIRITRLVTAEWLKFMGMDAMVRNGLAETWVGPSLTTTRTITTVAQKKLRLDVPLADSYDRKYLPADGAEVQRFASTGTISQSGVEYLAIEAPARHVTLGDPAFSAIRMQQIEDAWIRHVHVADTTDGISAGEGSRRITIEDVDFSHAAAIVGAAKPADFSINGTQTLILRATSTGNDLFYVVTGARNQGPNVVLESTFHGNGHLMPHQRWATALLVDNVKVPEGGIDLMNRGEMGSGHGWAMGWGVTWNSQAMTLLVQAPPGASNWSVGSSGKEVTGSMPTFPQINLPDLPQGTIVSPDKAVRPVSLYREQLKERLGEAALRALLAN